MTTIFRPATWNPADKGTSVTLSGGDLSMTAYLTSVRATKSVSSGKWYFESVATTRNPIVGVATGGASLASNLGADSYGWGYGGGGGAYTEHAGTSTYIGTLANGDVVGVAVDADAHTVDFYKNNVWQAGFTGLSTTLYAAVSGDSPGSIADSVTNFGATALTYSPPTGYYAGFGDIATVTEGTADVLLPAFNVVALNAPPSLITLPKLALDFASGLTAQIELPHLAVDIKMPGFSTTTLPALSAYVAAHNSTGEQALEVTLPSLAVSATTGAVVTGTLSPLAVSIDGTVILGGNVGVALPVLTSDAAGTVSTMAAADINLPAFGAAAYAGAVCSVTIGAVTLQATGTAGRVGRAQLTLPLFEATAAATTNAFGSATITLPALQLGNTSVAAASLPSLNLVAIGTAVVATTYEAYATNLKHGPRAPGEPEVDEVTHYTSFPFDYVVRYMDSYYGANSTGLYLLEGTTDAGADISYAIETAKTDFKQPAKKTITSAYFGGRIGAAETITLIAGDTTPNAYSYTTPRGLYAQNHRQAFGRGVKARYYALGVSGSAEFALDTMNLEIDQLTRRI